VADLSAARDEAVRRMLYTVHTSLHVRHIHIYSPYFMRIILGPKGKIERGEAFERRKWVDDPPFREC
jgi:hypothetical protein